MTVITDILDYGLLSINLYVLIRLKLSKEEAFRTPFFYWFFWTGIASSLSVVGFIIAVRFIFTAEHSWGFKFGYILNAVCVTFSTIGNIFISLHRYSVMRSASFIEDIWSSKMSYVLTSATLIFSLVACSPAFFCGLSYTTKGNVTIVLYLDDACTVVQKSRASAIYFIYVIVSLALTALTSREFVKLSRLAEDSTRALILFNQRNMFIIVSICTITQMIKAVHQFCWVFVAAFGLSDLNLFLQKTYDVTHYLSTYSVTASLVLFNKKVRMLMISSSLRGLSANNRTRSAVVSSANFSG